MFGYLHLAFAAVMMHILAFELWGLQWEAMTPTICGVGVTRWRGKHRRRRCWFMECSIFIRLSSVLAMSGTRMALQGPRQRDSHVPPFPSLQECLC